MELGSQVKKYRTELGLSQEELAEKIFVSRQSISNWENDKTYPDIKSLLLLSETFSVSLDTLIKGDIEKMKKEIDVQEKAEFMKNSRIYSILFAGLILLPVPLTHFFGWWGLAAYIIYFAVTLFYAFKVEQYKKRFDIHTYKEIVAFTEGKELDEIEKAREDGKRPYQKALAAVIGGVIAIVAAFVIAGIIKLIMGR